MNVLTAQSSGSVPNEEIYVELQFPGLRADADRRGFFFLGTAPGSCSAFRAPCLERFPRSRPATQRRDSIQHIDVCVLPVYNIVMKTTIDTIIAEVLSLSPQARAFVAEKLIESLDSEPEVTLSSAWREEVRKRCREVDEGSVELRDAEDVFARGYAPAS